MESQTHPVKDLEVLVAVRTEQTEDLLADSVAPDPRDAEPLGDVTNFDQRGGHSVSVRMWAIADSRPAS